MLNGGESVAVARLVSTGRTRACHCMHPKLDELDARKFIYTFCAQANASTVTYDVTEKLLYSLAMV
jgi:hypothetical protein